MSFENTGLPNISQKHSRSRCYLDPYSRRKTPYPRVVEISRKSHLRRSRGPTGGVRRLDSLSQGPRHLAPSRNHHNSPTLDPSTLDFSKIQPQISLTWGLDWEVMRVEFGAETPSPDSQTPWQPAAEVPASGSHGLPRPKGSEVGSREGPKHWEKFAWDSRGVFSATTEILFDF